MFAPTVQKLPLTQVMGIVWLLRTRITEQSAIQQILFRFSVTVLFRPPFSFPLPFLFSSFSSLSPPPHSEERKQGVNLWNFIVLMIHLHLCTGTHPHKHTYPPSHTLAFRDLSDLHKTGSIKRYLPLFLQSPLLQFRCCSSLPSFTVLLLQWFLAGQNSMSCGQNKEVLGGCTFKPEKPFV